MTKGSRLLGSRLLGRLLGSAAAVTTVTAVTAVAALATSSVGCAASGTDDDSSGASSRSDEFMERPIDCGEKGSTSFQAVRDAVYTAAPGNRVFAQGDMPKRGRPLRSLLDALGGGFSHDGSQILQCTRDFRANPENADKIIHAPGICASAVWEIDEASQGVNRNAGGVQTYTGLFAPKTRVNAIVRLSSGTNISNPSGTGILPSWGIAVKLFPAPSARPDAATTSVQIVMFDQSGVKGSSSREMLRSDDPAEPHFFINWMYGHDPFALTSLSIFNRFVRPHLHLGQPLERQARLQALDEVARVTVTGAEIPVAEAHYPTILKFALADGVPTLDQVAARAPGVDLSHDFRDQLLAYEDGELAFDIIGDNRAEGPEAMRATGKDQRIGRLTLDRMVVSEVCDKSLTFKHRRQGEVFTGWRPGDDK